MVHLRLNEKEANPNPHINFITPLKSNEEDEEDARKLLRALAAQVRPVMKAHGFVVNSLEEYEYNPVFAGRNWNNGETVELVLRRPDNSFCPNYWLMSTLCHELAHIKYMNHGPAFQALWARLRVEVRQLQDKGYYGDGYWSSGQRLCDSVRVADNGLEAGDLPEYLCGGAQSRARPTARRRRTKTSGKRREVVPSLHTGAQTAKKRKSGARVTSKFAFVGEGLSLGNDGKGTGFGRQAASKRAREERALAAERRLIGLQASSSSSALPKPSQDQSTSEEESDDEVIFVSETDAERRQAIQDAEHDEDTNQKLGHDCSWEQFKDDFNFERGRRESDHDPSKHGHLSPEIIELSSDDEDTSKVPSASSSVLPRAASHRSQPKVDTAKGKEKAVNIGIGKLVQSEIQHRKKESLGLAPINGGSQKLGSKTKADQVPQMHPLSNGRDKISSQETNGSWSCLACTLKNKPDHLSCAVCATPRNEFWTEDSQE